MNSSEPYSWLLGYQNHFSIAGKAIPKAIAPLQYKVLVIRNSTFEVFTPFLNKAAKMFGVQINWIFSNYTNTFEDSRYTETNQSIFFIDPRNLNLNVLTDILKLRLQEILTIVPGNIFVLVLGARSENEVMTNLISEFSEKVRIIFLIEELEICKFFTQRTEKTFGVGLESEAIQEISRRILFSVLLPSLFDRPKAIVLDLDNTLYEGVLGEDGHQGLEQSKGQSELLSTILELKRQHQIIIAICSRNEEHEVRNLFRIRSDLGLRENEFDFIFASWAPKEIMIQELLTILNIGSNSLIFIDDSPAELLQVSNAIPGILPIEADGTSLIPQLVIKIFESYVWTTSEVSSQMRVHDIKAGIVRKNIFSSRDGQDSLSKLGTHLLFEMNQRESINRAAEISIKTNQFNFSQQRYSPSMLTTIMNQKNKCVVVVSVKDDISDSGRIALITIELIENNIVVSEFAISCRALGRGLENEIFFGALNWFIEKIGKPKGVILHFRDAKRNQPCIQWLSSSFGVKPSSSIYIPISRLETFSSKVSREFRSI